MLGASRFLHGYFVLNVLFGVIPGILLPILITLLNTARLESTDLTLIHNQLFIGIFWVAFLALWRSQFNRYSRFVVRPVLKLLGLEQQHISKDSDVYPLVQNFLVYGQELCQEPVEWVPLNVLLELVDFRVIKAFNVKMHRCTRMNWDDFMRSPKPAWCSTAI